MATKKSKAPGGARPPVKGGMPQRIYAQASPHSQGGVSLFAGQEQITEHNVEGFCSESDLISRSISRLREAGFEVLQVSATSINIAGTQAQFEAAFNTRISTDERPVLKSQGVEDTATFLESKRGGYDVYQGMVDPALGARLLDEARQGLNGASLDELEQADSGPHDDASPPRRLYSAAGGAAQDAVYHAPWMAAALRRITGLHLRPTGMRGTYSAYAAGHFLALHRDIRTCDVSVITCLCDDGGESASGALRLYPRRCHEPLSAIGQAPDRDAIVVQLRPLQTLVIFGGIVPHEVLPVSGPRVRVTSLLCYQVPGLDCD